MDYASGKGVDSAEDFGWLDEAMAEEDARQMNEKKLTSCGRLPSCSRAFQKEIPKEPQEKRYVSWKVNPKKR